MSDRKVALVTGASRGIGRAIAQKLAESGMYVVVHYNGSEKSAMETLELVREAGSDGECMQCDVAKHGEMSAAVTALIKRLGQIDVLVNNAGITRDGLIMRMPEADFDQVIATNLKAAFTTIQAVSRQMMRQRSGRIINISSVSGILGNAGQANYAASKAGLIGLTKSMARELASRGITVNAVAPGFIETDMTEVLSDEIRDHAIQQIPVGRFGKAEEVAETVAFLASEKAGYLTGQVICVDGGMAM